VSCAGNQKPTWRVALDHRFTDDIVGYVSYNRGFKSGGYNTHSADNPPYNPETLDAYEIGAKTEWLAHRLRANAAAFYYGYTKVQVAKYTTTSPIYNGANSYSSGYCQEPDNFLRQRAYNLTDASVAWFRAMIG